MKLKRFLAILKVAAKGYKISPCDSFRIYKDNHCCCPIILVYEHLTGNVGRNEIAENYAVMIGMKQRLALAIMNAADDSIPLGRTEKRQNFLRGKIAEAIGLTTVA